MISYFAATFSLLLCAASWAWTPWMGGGWCGFKVSIQQVNTDIKCSTKSLPTSLTCANRLRLVRATTATWMMPFRRRSGWCRLGWGHVIRCWTDGWRTGIFFPRSFATTYLQTEMSSRHARGWHSSLWRKWQASFPVGVQGLGWQGEL